MEQPLPLLRPTPESQWERLYRYFVEAEEKQHVITSVKIQHVFLMDTGELRDLDTVRWYMYRYWRWFLFCVNDTVKPYQYRCRNIKNYPLDYFVQAHTIPNRMQFLAHFVRSIETDKELRKQAAGRGQPRKPRQEEVLVQMPLGVDEQGEITVDDHEEEEGPLQGIPDIVLDSPAVEPETVSPSSPHALPDNEEVESSIPARLDTTRSPMQEVPQNDGIVKPSPRPSPLSEMKSISPLLIVGAIAVGCVVVAAAYFFFIKHPR